VKPENGTIALVLANGSDAVLGTFHREGQSRMRVEPLDHSRRTVRAARTLLQGIVRAVIRRY
jgi:hypothetical protein